ncbi:TPA: 50S ribosomal protein L18 [Candidatus Nomurabacteria bacterium]|nr:MAG: 50S ribosomal protein L18 [Parcubacteria bacterium RAAC4_OD1_1]HCY26269.1 50S ribosomal protein L18 [Candidatus Nomurabacteria bacterium]
MNKKQEKRIRLKSKIRAKIFGTKERPRLSVFRSNSYIYAQIINDDIGETIVSSSDITMKTGSKMDRSKKVGEEVAKNALSKGVKSCVFDRNGFKYTGRIKALAESARVSGLSF